MRRSRTAWICECVVPHSILWLLLESGRYPLLLAYPMDSSGDLLLTLSKRQPALHAIKFTGIASMMDGSGNDSTQSCNTARNAKRAIDYPTPSNSKIQRHHTDTKAAGSNSWHSIFPVGQSRKRGRRTISIASAIGLRGEDIVSTPSHPANRPHPISIFAELRGQGAFSAAPGTRARTVIAIADALHPDGKRNPCSLTGGVD